MTEDPGSADHPSLREQLSTAIDDVFARWEAGLGSERPQDAIREAVLAVLPSDDRAADADADLIEDYLRFLRGQGPEPDLSELSPEERVTLAGQLKIVRALADRDPNLPPLEHDPVARRLGLHQPAEAQHRRGDQTHGLSVQHADALWDAVAIPGPSAPTYPEQHDRVCRAVAEIIDEVTAMAAMARSSARRLHAVDRLCSGRPGYHTITVKALLTAMSEADDEAQQDGARQSDDYEATTGHLITCLAVAGGAPDPDCPCTKAQDR